MFESEPKTIAMPSWGPLRHPERAGVVTGCDHRQQWLLPWWYDCLRQHNPSLPVVFADFGMDAAGLRWCRRHGDVVTVSWRDYIWYAKPQAMLQAGYAHTLWLDLDCEVRTSLQPLLTSPYQDLAVCHDDYNYLGPNKPQAGVVMIRHGTVLPQRWAGYCALGFAARQVIPDPRQCCDQAVLVWLAERYPEHVTILPSTWNRLHRMGHNEDAKIIHYAGRDKDAIRQQLAKGIAHAATAGTQA
jgi:hypothetical protein